jgi:hypothetical protein
VLDRRSEQEQDQIERQEKALAEYRAQLNKPFEHEARLRELLAKQAHLNAMLDLDKRESQVGAEKSEVPTSFAARVMAEGREAATAL